MANYNTPTTWAKTDWDSLTIQDTGSTITGINTQWNLNLPGALLDYSFEYDMDYLKTSGLPEDEQNRIFKKELATKLVEKMIDDGHILFTKQAMMERHAVRFRAYTWVGNKDFIEQQRKNNAIR